MAPAFMEADERMARSEVLEILGKLPRRRFYQALVLILVILAGGVSQALLIANVSPFLQLIGSSEQHVHIGILSYITHGEIEALDRADALLFACLLFGGLAISTGSLRLMSAWGNGELTAKISIDLSRTCLAKLLYDPYILHLRRNSSHVIGDLRQVDAFTTGIVAPTIQIAAALVTITASAAAAIAVSWQATLLALTLVGAIYIAISWQLKKPLRMIGEKIVGHNRRELKIQQESLGAIRDIILDNSQDIFIRSYMRSVRDSRKLGARLGFLQIAPRYSIEALGFVAIAVIGWLFSRRSGGLMLGLPTLGALAVAYQSILPSIQQIYSCWSSFKTSRASIHVVWSMAQPYGNQNAQNTLASSQQGIANRMDWERISFQQVSFSYSQSDDGKNETTALSGLDISIQRGDRIGIVGKTGSGKSTTADLLMGLLTPTTGEILIDHQQLGSSHWTLDQWRRGIAHVPQHIFLTDASIAENIAFGQSYEAINWERLELAAELAQLTDVVQGLPMGWQTPVGERGTRLSGGQRQRIGLGRAFYKQADLVILDEATSALDYSTEAKVIHSVEGLGRNLTIIMIAHRIQTLALCDRILVFRDGKVVGDDTYQELQKKNHYFREMALLA
jgi:ABC-type multidrug transport system fused ATPase/permease subunit